MDTSKRQIEIIAIVAFIAVALFVLLFMLPKGNSPANTITTVPQHQPSQNDFVDKELQGLVITTVGEPDKTELTLPQELTGPNWGMTKTICEQGGYDLSSYAGMTVIFAKYQTNKNYIGPNHAQEPVDVLVLTSGEDIACVYFTVREDSTFAPGIFSVKDGSIINQNSATGECVKEGGTFSPNEGQCCLKLTASGNDYVDSAGACVQVMEHGKHLVCIKCGDGVCGSGETNCNCPDDCP